MLYLTLEDDPFPDQEYDENALLELVRSVARRDGDDRTVSELIRFQDSLERLGLLWTPLDSLDKYQAHELVRNLHLELASPGDMVYVKHSPAMRSYVVLRGTILLTNNVLDREGVDGVRVLGPGGEFGHPLDPELDLDKPVADFEEYAKAPHIEPLLEGGFEPAPATRGNSRKDGRAELLVIGRQDWVSTLGSSRNNFAQLVSKGALTNDPNDFKTRARLAFNFPAKGRSGIHLKIATEYLMERVPFCKDLPLEQVSAMAAAVELWGLAVSRRIIFRRGRECHGEAYIMFTGTADQKGVNASEDRLIREGDLFGDEYLTAAVKDVHGPPFRTTTAMSRTSPCELLVIPSRECRRLQGFVALRNSKKAISIFEKFFINLPREAFSEIATLATFRTIKMNETLAAAGDDVSTVFFVFRGECISKPSNRQHAKCKGETHRYGPGHIVGWPYIMPDAPTTCDISARTGGNGPAASPNTLAGGGKGRAGEPQEQIEEGAKDTKRRRPRRHEKEWQDTVTVATPARVLSVPLVALVRMLSEKALEGLRNYISLTHKQNLDEISSGVDDDDDPLHGSSAFGWSNFSTKAYDPTSILEGAGSEQSKPLINPSSSFSGRRPSTAPGLVLNNNNHQRNTPDNGARRSNTPPVAEEAAAFMRGAAEAAIGSKTNRFRSRPKTRTRWHWRVNLLDMDDTTSQDFQVTSSASPDDRLQFRQYSCLRSSSSPARMVWGYLRQRERAVISRRGKRRGESRGGCSCPMECCRCCSPLLRLERLQKTPVWTPTLPSRSSKSHSAPAVADANPNGKEVVGECAKNVASASAPLLADGRPSTYGASPGRASEAVSEGNNNKLLREGIVVSGSVPSYRLSSRGVDMKTKGEYIDRSKGGIGDADMRLANGGEDDRRGRALGSPHRKNGASSCVDTLPSSAHRSKIVVAPAPVSDFGIATGSLGIESCGVDRKSEGSAAAAHPPDRSDERLTCTLVQLSTRESLDPSDASALLCLRILGSFTCETEAKTRLANLYHSVLPTKLIWLPCQGPSDGKLAHQAFENFSDHVFLLRKGVPASRLSFNVVNTADDIDTNTCIENNLTSNGDARCPSINTSSATINATATVVTTATATSNPNDGADSLLPSSSTDDASKSSSKRPTVAADGIGRGYDATIPAVFKAKGQHFAVVFAPPHDRIERDRVKHLKLLERDLLAVRTSRSMAENPLDPRGTVSTSSVGSSDSSVSRANRSSHQYEGQDDHELRSNLQYDNRCLTGGQAGDVADEARLAGEVDVPRDSPGAEEVEVARQGHCVVGHGVDDNAGVMGGTDGQGAQIASLICPVEESKVELPHEGYIASSDEEDDGSGGEGEDEGEDKHDDNKDDEDDEDEDDDNQDRDDNGRGWNLHRLTNESELSTESGPSHAASAGRPREMTSEKRAEISWIVSRMGFLENVEGCYETEVKAFKKAIEILEKRETALSSTRMPVGSTIAERHGGEDRTAAEENNKHRDEREQDARNSQEERQRRPPQRIHDDRACILPLYEWLSLGDGGIDDVQAAIENRCISDPSEAERAGVDPFALWTEQRARRLRQNLYNLLSAAGPREIWSRCGHSTAGDGTRGGTGRKPGGRHRGLCTGGSGVHVDGRVEDRKLRGMGRAVAKEVIRSARAAVLQQNQKLIQTEMKVRHRLAKSLTSRMGLPVAPADDNAAYSHWQSAPVLSLETTSLGREGTDVSVSSKEKRSAIDESGSVGGKSSLLGFTGGGSCGSGGSCGRDGRGGSGKKGLRHNLRIQMNIERKRARLFEDIRMLPYSETERGTKCIKAKTNAITSSSTDRITAIGSKAKLIDEDCRQVRNCRGGDHPPAITFRAPTIQAQKRLHGKPPASFFSKAHSTGAGAALSSKPVAAPAVEAVDESARYCCSSATPSLTTATAAAAVSAPRSGEEQQQQAASSAFKALPTEGYSAVADVVADPPHSPHPTSDKESTASLPSAASASKSAVDDNAVEVQGASVQDGSCASTASDGHDTVAGSTIVMESATLDLSTFSRNSNEVVSIPRSGGKSRNVRPATTGAISRSARGRVVGPRSAGGRPVVRGEDAWSTSRAPANVCSLDGELLLLDSILHDRKVRMWAETTLLPARKHHNRVATS